MERATVMETEKFDISIEGGTLLTMSAKMEIMENATIGIQGDLIALVGSNCRIQAHKTINAKGHLVLPGLINTHTHLPMVCFRGLADDLP